MSYYEMIKKVLYIINEELKMNKINILYEDDLLARIYNKIINEYYNKIYDRIYIKSKIVNDNNDKNKYDLVIGNIVKDNKGKKCIEPNMISEIKIYSESFSEQQLSKRRNGINDDINKLIELKKIHKKCEYIVIYYDGKNWLERRNKNKGKTNIKIILENKTNDEIKLIGIRNNKIYENWTI